MKCLTRQPFLLAGNAKKIVVMCCIKSRKAIVNIDNTGVDIHNGFVCFLLK